MLELATAAGSLPERAEYTAPRRNSPWVRGFYVGDPGDGVIFFSKNDLSLHNFAGQSPADKYHAFVSAGDAAPVA
ncbi:hypothetical protein AGMMS49957_12360 [Synergistales bacterium]|nr:hypothetical protein AGMMS49957_12360 [Synergistales bacterium]